MACLANPLTACDHSDTDKHNANKHPYPQGLDEVVDRVEVLTQLVADGQDTLAQQWATSLGRDYQVGVLVFTVCGDAAGGARVGRSDCWTATTLHTPPPMCRCARGDHTFVHLFCLHTTLSQQISFVEACVALDRLKPAARAVRQLHLAAEFPNVEALYRQRSLSRLISRRLWSVAQSYAGNDVTLQVVAVERHSATGNEVGDSVLCKRQCKQNAAVWRHILYRAHGLSAASHPFFLR